MFQSEYFKRLYHVVHTVHALAKANPPPSKRVIFQGMRAATVFQSSKLGISMTSSRGLPAKIDFVSTFTGVCYLRH